jgi:hypothetical protein
MTIEPRLLEPAPARRHSSGESGYALLFAVFLVASMAVFAAIVTPNLLTEGKREKEQQLIWRGNQYVRAIRLYFQKNGRFPANMEELEKGTLDVHFLRKEFKDPTSKEDGSWRPIYVNPSGQLVGSVKYHTLQEMAAQLGRGFELNTTLPMVLMSLSPQQSAAGRGAAPPGAASQSNGAGRGSAPAGAPQPPVPAVPLGAVDGPVFGASLIGVASKNKSSSLLVYQRTATYFEWEFIWNPLVSSVAAAPPDLVRPAAPPRPTGPENLPPGAAPTGQSPDFPIGTIQ